MLFTDQELSSAVAVATLGSTVQGDWIGLDVAKLPLNVIVRMMEYGAQRLINDTANKGGASATPESKIAAAKDFVAMLYDGKTGKRTIRLPEDPEETALKQLVLEALGKRAEKISQADLEAVMDANRDKLTAEIAARVAKNRADAEARAAAREAKANAAKAVAGKLDLGALKL